MNVYIASPRSEFPVARHLARDLAAAGHRIVSTWHTLPDLDAPGDETLDPGLRRELLERCRADIQRAEVMVAWTAVGTPRATIGEIVCMIETLSRPAIWIEGPRGEGGNIWDEHDNVLVVRHTGNGTETLGAVLAILHGIEQHKVEDHLRELDEDAGFAGPLSLACLGVAR